MTAKDYIDTKGCEGDGRVLGRGMKSNLRCVEGQSI